MPYMYLQSKHNHLHKHYKSQHHHNLSSPQYMLDKYLRLGTPSYFQGKILDHIQSTHNNYQQVHNLHHIQNKLNSHKKYIQLDILCMCYLIGRNHQHKLNNHYLMYMSHNCLDSVHRILYESLDNRLHSKYFYKCH